MKRKMNGCCGGKERMFLTREERIELLKEYEETLRKEADGVKERIEELRKAE